MEVRIENSLSPKRTFKCWCRYFTNSMKHKHECQICYDQFIYTVQVCLLSLCITLFIYAINANQDLYFESRSNNLNPKLQHRTKKDQTLSSKYLLKFSERMLFPSNLNYWMETKWGTIIVNSKCTCLGKIIVLTGFLCAALLITSDS